MFQNQSIISGSGAKEKKLHPEREHNNYRFYFNPGFKYFKSGDQVNAMGLKN
jgi:hypothetical protein